MSALHDSKGSVVLRCSCSDELRAWVHGAAPSRRASPPRATDAYSPLATGDVHLSAVRVAAVLIRAGSTRFISATRDASSGTT